MSCINKSLFRSTCLAVAAACAVGSGASAGPAFQFTTQNRGVEAKASVRNQSTDERDASDQFSQVLTMQSWSDQLDASAKLSMNDSYAAAMHSSALASDHITGNGWATLKLSDTETNFESQATARSFFEVGFLLDRTTTVRLQASISDAFNSFVKLEGASGVLAELSDSEGESLYLDLTLTLAPGSYMLSAASILEAALAPCESGVQGKGDWCVDLTVVPTPGSASLAMAALLLGARRRRSR